MHSLLQSCWVFMDKQESRKHTWWEQAGCSCDVLWAQHCHAAGRGSAPIWAQVQSFISQHICKKKRYGKTHFSNWAELNGGNGIILMLYTWNCTMRQRCHGYSSCMAFSATKFRYLYGYVETEGQTAECWTCLPLGTWESSNVDICMRN